MIFQRLEIRNFKSFAGVHTFDFTQFGPGLYFLTGKNLAEPELGANGVGKSTLWDALYWVIYGRTLRGLRAGECLTWLKPPKQPLKGRQQAPADAPTGGISPKRGDTNPPLRKKSCYGSLVMALDHRKVLIQRSWNPNSLWVYIDGENKITTQEDLESLLGLDGESFQQSVIIGQFSRMFFDLRPAEKLTLFSELMDLEFWQERSKAAAAELEGIQSEYEEVERQIISLRATRAEVRRALDNEREFQTNYVQTKADRRKKLEEQIEEKVQIVERLNQKLIDCREACEKLARKVEASRRVVSTDIVEAEEVVGHRIQSQLVVSENNSQNVKKQLLRLERVRGQCPVCGQKVNEIHIKSERNRLSGQLISYQREKLVLENEMKQFQKKIGALRKEATLIRTKNQVVIDQYNLALREVQAVELDVVKHTERMKGLLSDLSEIKGERSPHKTQIVECKQRSESLRTKIIKFKDTMNKLEGTLQAVSFWVKGFKDIRLSIIETTLDALTVEVNNYLGALGMENWAVKFDVERETKGGSVSRGFQVFVQSPNSPSGDLVPLEAWSGGEGQRLRLAGTLGLANLILDQRGITTNLQVWDEPLYGLSGTGRDDALELFREQAHTTGKQIWLVDHRALEFGFDRVVCINKDKAGSHIILE